MCMKIWYTLEYAGRLIRLSKGKEEEFDGRK